MLSCLGSRDCLPLRLEFDRLIMAHPLLMFLTTGLDKGAHSQHLPTENSPGGRLYGKTPPPLLDDLLDFFLFVDVRIRIQLLSSLFITLKLY